jgi:hypothetical protein
VLAGLARVIGPTLVAASIVVLSVILTRRFILTSSRVIA